jgi:hypothetical protein
VCVCVCVCVFIEKVGDEKEVEEHLEAKDEATVGLFHVEENPPLVLRFPALIANL